MRSKRIGILALQETHLEPEHLNDVNTLYGKQFLVLNSSDPLRPGTSAGVAFVLNKSLILTDDCNLTVLREGRATILSIKWHGEERITLLNIYAPNNYTEQTEFWQSLEEEWVDRNLPKPDFVLGDFNMVEIPMDRAPARTDPANAVQAFQNLRLQLNVTDKWREQYPKERMFTYRGHTNNVVSNSRLDRIYVAHDQAEHVYEWGNETTGSLPTDHWIVSVRYAPIAAPYIGSGRWTWPLWLINDRTLMSEIAKKGIELQKELEQLLVEPNPEKKKQTMWKTFKDDI
ncbi:DNase I-like protein, partial [Artomyces pyxidatus]